MLSNRATIMALAWACGLSCPLCRAENISATEDARGITVVIPGALKVLVNKSRGFGARMYDLRSAPDYNLSSAYSGNGMLWVSTSPVAGPKSLANQYYANPIDTLELLESGPARVLVRLGGAHAAWGQGGKLPGVRFTESFAMYPSGAVYGEYALEVGDAPVSLYYLAAGVVTTGYWGPHGLNQVRSAGEFGPQRFAGATASSFILQFSDGPDYFTDVLLAMYKGRYDSGNFWNFDEGRMLELGTNVNLTSLLPANPIPAGSRTVMNFMIRFSDDMNGHERAAAYARDYRSPDRLAVRAGGAVRSDDGDHDEDGFNEREGCYVLSSAAQGVEFTLHGADVARMSPAFKVREWTGPAPETILLGDEKLAAGRDFAASVRGGVLLVHLLRDVEKDAALVIAKSSAPAEAAGGPQEGEAKPAAAAGAVEELIFGAVEKMLSAKPDAGGKPVLSCNGCGLSLLRDCEIAEGRTALRIDIRSDTWKVGSTEVDPERGVWDGYDRLTFDVYNPQKDMNSLVLMIGGEGVKSKDGAWCKEMLLRPGRNRVEIRLSGAPVDWKKAVSRWELSQFQMSTSVGTCLYLMNFRLENGPERAEREKGVNVIRIEGGRRFQVLE